MPRFFPTITATRLQTATYFLGIALFSIAFLVFLNSSLSFVVTEVIRSKEPVGDAVGTLGFADELLALVACPLWGLLSDRIGVRTVAVLGYCIVGFSLICLVQSTNVYPELLITRLAFSLGGAACTTMVTAILPAMVAGKTVRYNGTEENGSHVTTGGHATRARDDEGRSRNGSIGHAASASVSSEVTMTQHRYISNSRTGTNGTTRPNSDKESIDDTTGGTSQLAGFVGLFTGAGALVALLVFLPLPAYFQNAGQSQAKSVQSSFYIVGSMAFLVALFIFVGLRNLPGEREKSFAALWTRPYDESTKTDAAGNVHIMLTPAPSYFALVRESVKLGFTDPNIAMGYVGGFVARASSVGISLFIPLFVNAYFVRNELCTSNPDNLADIKENCQRAYKLAAALTGIAETAALICAPLFGYVGSGRLFKGRTEWPLLLAGVSGVCGYIWFGFLQSPDPFHGHGGGWTLVAVVLIGISQIGSIVCSLGLLGRGVVHHVDSKQSAGEVQPAAPGTLRPEDIEPGEELEAAPLLLDASSVVQDERPRDRRHLKGSIAGVYSFLGGLGILILSKVGGALFDSWLPGAPFFLMAVFNGVMIIAVALIGGGSAIKDRRKQRLVTRDD